MGMSAESAKKGSCLMFYIEAADLRTENSRVHDESGISKGLHRIIPYRPPLSSARGAPCECGTPLGDRRGPTQLVANETRPPIFFKRIMFD